VGGATIIERIYLRKGVKFVFTPNGWFYWNGIIWVADEGGSHILRIMREELVKVEKGYLAERGSNLKARSDEASMESDDESLTESGTGGSAKKKEPKIVNFNFNAKMSNVLTTCKDLFFNAGFEGKLDFNRDFRAAQNGVIDLKTGGFQPHHPRVSATNRLALCTLELSTCFSSQPPSLCRSLSGVLVGRGPPSHRLSSIFLQFLHSKYMSWAYPSTGLATPQDDILRVLRDIMHAEALDGQLAMDHLQCFLGYGLTGHTSSQVRLEGVHLLWFYLKTILLESLTKVSPRCT
jgi:hypothetical protein